MSYSQNQVKRGAPRPKARKAPIIPQELCNFDQHIAKMQAQPRLVYAPQPATSPWTNRRRALADKATVFPHVTISPSAVFSDKPTNPDPPKPPNASDTSNKTAIMALMLPESIKPTHMEDIGGADNTTAQNVCWSDDVDQEAKIKSVIIEMTVPSCPPMSDIIAVTLRDDTLFSPVVSHSMALAAPEHAGWADIDIPALILNPEAELAKFPLLHAAVRDTKVNSAILERYTYMKDWETPTTIVQREIYKQRKQRIELIEQCMVVLTTQSAIQPHKKGLLIECLNAKHQELSELVKADPIIHWVKD